MASLKNIEIITDPKRARILVDPMRREIVRLLAQREMSQSDLGESLGLSIPAVAHHLKVLKNTRFVRVVKRRIEKHGIVEKLYRTYALAYLIDTHKIPLQIERYFTHASLERVRSIVATVTALANDPEGVSTEEIEKFAEIMTSAILHVAPKHSAHPDSDREEVIVQMYRDAFTYLSEKPDLLPDRIRTLLRGARQHAKESVPPAVTGVTIAVPDSQGN